MSDGFRLVMRFYMAALLLFGSPCLVAGEEDVSPYAELRPGDWARHMTTITSERADQTGRMEAWCMEFRLVIARDDEAVELVVLSTDNEEGEWRASLGNKSFPESLEEAIDGELGGPALFVGEMADTLRSDEGKKGAVVEFAEMEESEGDETFFLADTPRRCRYKKLSMSATTPPGFVFSGTAKLVYAPESPWFVMQRLTGWVERGGEWRHVVQLEDADNMERRRPPLPEDAEKALNEFLEKWKAEESKAAD